MDYMDIIMCEYIEYLVKETGAKNPKAIEILKKALFSLQQGGGLFDDIVSESKPKQAPPTKQQAPPTKQQAPPFAADSESEDDIAAPVKGK